MAAAKEAAKTKTQTYVVGAKVSGSLGKSIEATSWEQALEKAQALKFTDFVDVRNLDYNDSGPVVIDSIWISK